MGALQPPEGYRRVESSAFLELTGPIYMDTTVTPVRFGAFVLEQHLNTMGGAHGGFLGTLIDVAVGRGARFALDDGRALRTASMSLDYISGARLGDWLDLDVSIDRAGRRTVFTSCRVTRAGELVARASVILV